MQMNIEECKDRTRELADDIVVAQLLRQEALLSVPSVLFEVISDLSLGASSQLKACRRMFAAIRLDGAWFRVSQLSAARVASFAHGLLDEVQFHYPGAVSRDVVGDRKASVVDFGARKLSVIFQDVVFSDVYLKDFFGAAEDISDPQMVQQYASSQKSLQDSVTEMMRLNERSFRSVLRPYVTGNSDCDEIEAVAYEGFYRACMKYFPSENTDFYCALQRWVRARVVQYFDREASILSVSNSSGALFRKIRRARLDLQSEGNVVSLSAVARKLGADIREVSACEEAFTSWSEYDDILHGEPSTGLSVNPEDLLGRDEGKALVVQMLSQLPNREAQVLVGRYGLGCKPKTLEEIGESLGVTLEGARQIQARAERRLAQTYAEAGESHSFV